MLVALYCSIASIDQTGPVYTESSSTASKKAQDVKLNVTERKPASFDEPTISDPDTEELIIHVSPIEAHEKNQTGVPYIAATIEDLKTDADVQTLMQTRADIICRQMGLKHNKPHHRCKTFETKNVEDSKDDKILLDPVTMKTVNDHPKRVDYKTKNDYCQTLYAQEKDGSFCESALSSVEAQILHPKKFTLVTCLLRSSPFPREPNRVKRQNPSIHPGGQHTPSHRVHSTQ